MKYEALDIEILWIRGIAKPICISISDEDKINTKIVDKNEIDDKKILNFMLEKCKNKRIYYVHNLTFEGIVFIKELIDLGIKFKFLSINGNIYSMDIFYKRKRIKLRCSYRLTMLSLDKLSEMCGYEKQSFPYKILNEKMNKYMKISEKEFNNKLEYDKFMKENKIECKYINMYKLIKKYCENDVIITKKSVIDFWKTLSEFNIKNDGKMLTAAKISIKNYLDNYKGIKSKIKTKDDELLRKSYFGGRTEVFGNIKDNEICLHFDWSGMYAQCMKENILDGDWFESKSRDYKEPGFYYIKFKQKMEIPVLPIKRGKLIFANGVFEGWYWFEEILLFVERGGIVLEVNKCISSRYFDKFISEYVDKNNEIRKMGGVYKQIGKNNNNSLYGRFGMNKKLLKEEIYEEGKKYEIIKYKGGIKFGCNYEENKLTNVGIASIITSKARIKLYKGFMEVQKEGGRVLYCDTDSIIAAFDKRNYKNKLDKKFGEVMFDSSDNKTIIEDCVFTSPKSYALKYKNGVEIVKIKGIKTYPNFNKFKWFFYKGISFNIKQMNWEKKNMIYELVEVEKKVNLRNLDKRIWCEDLKETKTLNL